MLFPYAETPGYPGVFCGADKFTSKSSVIESFISGAQIYPILSICLSAIIHFPLHFMIRILLY